MATSRRAQGTFFRTVVLTGLMALLTGCVNDYLARWRGTGYDEKTKEFTSEIPQRAKEGKPFSFSTKAQEIEKDFGFE
jgi:hypothetical protein